MNKPAPILKDFATPPQGRLRVGPAAVQIVGGSSTGEPPDGVPAPGTSDAAESFEPFAEGPDPDEPQELTRPVAVKATLAWPKERIPEPQKAKRARATITAGGMRLSVPVVGVDVCKYGFAVRMSMESDSILFEPTVGTEVSVTWDGKEYLGYFPGLSFAINGELVLAFVAKEA